MRLLWKMELVLLLGEMISCLCGVAFRVRISLHEPTPKCLLFLMGFQELTKYNVNLLKRLPSYHGADFHNGKPFAIVFG